MRIRSFGEQQLLEQRHKLPSGELEQHIELLLELEQLLCDIGDVLLELLLLLVGDGIEQHAVVDTDIVVVEAVGVAQRQLQLDEVLQLGVVEVPLGVVLQLVGPEPELVQRSVVEVGPEPELVQRSVVEIGPEPELVQRSVVEIGPEPELVQRPVVEVGQHKDYKIHVQ